MTHAAQLEMDAKPSDKSVQSMHEFTNNFATTLRMALHNTFRYGQGTRDMCGPTGKCALVLCIQYEVLTSLLLHLTLLCLYLIAFISRIP